MKLHLLSDIHLESEGYTIPEDLDFDVLVVAGDIHEDPERGIEWLSAAGNRKPVVVVLGNHDYWWTTLRWLPDENAVKEDFMDRHDRWHRLADATENVYLLEYEAVIIGDTRFLGATYWTDFGGGDKRLANYAHRCMKDFGSMRADRWFESEERVEEFRRDARHLGFDSDEISRAIEAKRFHPAIAYRLNRSAMDFFQEELGEHGSLPPRFADDLDTRIPASWKYTVCVSHYLPTWQALGPPEVEDAAFDEKRWDSLDIRWDHAGVYRLAAYACKYDAVLHECAEEIDIWLCGHLHASVDVAAQGVRVLSNPRGYYNGDGRGFDAREIIDLKTQAGYMAPLKIEVDKACLKIEAMIADVERHVAARKGMRGLVLKAIEEAADRRFEALTGAFHAIIRRINDNLSGYMIDRNRLDFPVHGWQAQTPEFSFAFARSTRGRGHNFPTAALTIRRARQLAGLLRKIDRLPGLLAAEIRKQVAAAIETLRAAGYEARRRKVRDRYERSEIVLEVVGLKAAERAGVRVCDLLEQQQRDALFIRLVDAGDE